jgi:hypothetical protein
MSSKDKKMSATWDDFLRGKFIAAVKAEVLKGLNVENGFKKQHWKNIRDEFIRLGNVDFSKEQLQNQLAYLKKNSKYFKQLKIIRDSVGMIVGIFPSQIRMCGPRTSTFTKKLRNFVIKLYLIMMISPKFLQATLPLEITLPQR